MQRAIKGLCVAWKPLMAPQAIVMNRQGTMGLFAMNVSLPSHAGFGFRLAAERSLHSSGIVGCFTKRPTNRANAMNSNEKANNG